MGDTALPPDRDRLSDSAPLGVSGEIVVCRKSPGNVRFNTPSSEGVSLLVCTSDVARERVDGSGKMCPSRVARPLDALLLRSREILVAGSECSGGLRLFPSDSGGDVWLPLSRMRHLDDGVPIAGRIGVDGGVSPLERLDARARVVDKFSEREARCFNAPFTSGIRVCDGLVASLAPPECNSLRRSTRENRAEELGACAGDRCDVLLLSFDNSSLTDGWRLNRPARLARLLMRGNRNDVEGASASVSALRVPGHNAARKEDAGWEAISNSDDNRRVSGIGEIGVRLGCGDRVSLGDSAMGMSVCSDSGGMLAQSVTPVLGDMTRKL